MKQSGINYFYNQVMGFTNTLQVFYTFEDGTGNLITNNATGVYDYSGLLSSVGNFWQVPGSGYSTGQSIQVIDASGLSSNNWTKTFVMRKVNNQDVILFSNLQSGSGYAIGINQANKPYFKTTNNYIDYIYTSQNNLSSENIFSVSKIGNNIQFGYYDLTNEKIEYESYNFNYVISPSNTWSLVPNFTGYLDYFLYFNQNLSFSAQQQIYSGFCYNNTGIINLSQAILISGVTGFISGYSTLTGVTGFTTVASTGAGAGYYTGLFPVSGISTPLTGILSQTYFSSGLTGLIISGFVTGSVLGYSYNSGYAQLLGMEKIVNYFPITGTDFTNLTVDRTTKNPVYNTNALGLVSGYLLNNTYNSNQINPYLNGLYNNTGDFFIQSGILYITFGNVSSPVFFDIDTGIKKIINYTGSGTPISENGQEIYLNGLKLVSGNDYINSGLNLYLIGQNTGVTGIINQNGLILVDITGNFTYYTGQTFARYSSRFFLNGLRQQLNNDYFEGSLIDLLSGNSYNYINVSNLYSNDGNYWTTLG